MNTEERPNPSQNPKRHTAAGRSDPRQGQPHQDALSKGQEDRPVVRRQSGWLRYAVFGGLLLLGTAAILLSLNRVPGVDVDNLIGRLKAKHSRADLVEPALNPTYNVRALEGFSTRTDPATHEMVFCGGVRFHLYLVHNKRGEEPILINEMSLEVEQFTPGKDAGLSTSKDFFPTASPEGPVPPEHFSVSLRGKTIEPATWSREDNASPPVSAQGVNFFDTPEPKVYQVTNAADGKQVIAGNVLLQETGLYVLRLRIGYTVGGEARQFRSEPIRTYLESK